MQAKVTINGRDLAHGEFLTLKYAVAHWLDQAEREAVTLASLMTHDEKTHQAEGIESAKQVLQMLLDDPPKSNLEATQWT